MKIVLFTSLALFAFAFNSILCRLALAGGEADAAGFTAVRLVSGAAALLLLATIFSSTRVSKVDTLDAAPLPSLLGRMLRSGSWQSAFFLFVYAIFFSFAYLGLTASAGALILFGSVQITMIAFAVAKGERPSLFEWIGLLVAVGGLIYLVLPGLGSPPLVSSLLMAAAGAAWGGYTLKGKGAGDPLGNTTGNFLRSLPFAVLMLPIFLGEMRITRFGLLLGVLSGALASGVGYAVWYAALTGLTSTRAAVLQLSVPLIAALLAVLLLDEMLTLRLIFAALLILGGIAITIAGREQAKAI